MRNLHQTVDLKDARDLGEKPVDEAKVVWQWLAGLVRFGQSRIRTLPSDRQSRRGRTTPPRADQGNAAVGARNPSSDGQFARAIFRGQDCKVTKVIYAGDEGGVICHLAFDEEDKEEVFLVSVTHLAFDRRLPVARKIAAYRKHCIKHLRRDGSTDAPAAYH